MKKRRGDEQSSRVVESSITEVSQAPIPDSPPGRPLSPSPVLGRGFSTSTVIELMSSLASLGSLMIAIYALVTTLQFRRELAYPEQVSHIADLFIEMYLDRRFPEKLSIGGKSYTTLKEVRELVRRRMRGKPLEEQRKLLDEFREATLQPDSWENAFAYQLTLAQERVGAMVFTGVLPLETVLAVNNYGILEDWAYSSRLVEGLIRQPEDPTSSVGAVPFQRRHGEWLACVAAIYSWKYWHGAKRDDKQDLSVSYLGTKEVILTKEQTLRTFEQAILYSRAERSVLALRRSE